MESYVRSALGGVWNAVVLEGSRMCECRCSRCVQFVVGDEVVLHIDQYDFRRISVAVRNVRQKRRFLTDFRNCIVIAPCVGGAYVFTWKVTALHADVWYTCTGVGQVGGALC